MSGRGSEVVTPRLRFRRQKSERGLARHMQGERGYDLMLGDERIGGVYPRYARFERNSGYYWYAHVGKESRNTASEPVPTIEQAKADCMAWVRERMKEVSR